MTRGDRSSHQRSLLAQTVTVGKQDGVVKPHTQPDSLLSGGAQEVMTANFTSSARSEGAWLNGDSLRTTLRFLNNEASSHPRS